MAKQKKPYVNVVIFGALSIASYIFLFMNAEFVMENFTRGGTSAALPVATALYFSFLHGAFASNVLDVLGIEAKKKK